MRDELIVLNVEKIALVSASGNYSKVVLTNRHELMLPIGISKLEEKIKNVTWGEPRFIRLGRSLLINHSLLLKIEVLKQTLTLSDGNEDIKVSVPKNTLKNYKEAIEQSIKIKNNDGNNIRQGRQPAL